jgi:hypothetical protein
VNCPRPLKHWGRGFKYHSGHCCLPLYCLCFLRWWPDRPPKGSYRRCKLLEAVKHRLGFIKGFWSPLLLLYPHMMFYFKNVHKLDAQWR